MTNLTLIKYGLIFALIVSVLSTAYYQGKRSVQREWDLSQAIIDKQIAELKAKQEQITTKVVTEYVDRVKIVKEKGDTVVKYVDRYITEEQDNNCVISNNVVSLHNAAAENRLPTTAEVTDGTASEVKISELTRTVTENYGICNQIREQVIGLQQWITEQHAIK